jgi:hypothetical protein
MRHARRTTYGGRLAHACAVRSSGAPVLTFRGLEESLWRQGRKRSIMKKGGGDSSQEIAPLLFGAVDILVLL